MPHLKNGEKVIVKVQRPDIREIIETDIAILGIIVRLLIKHLPESKIFNPEGIVDEFSKTVKKRTGFYCGGTERTTFQKKL